MTHTIIQFSNIENLYNRVLNIIMWSFNLFLFNLGLYYLLNNYENLNTKNGLQDCENVFIIISFNVLNAFLILIGFFRFLAQSVFTFSSSIFLLGYQSYSVATINTNFTKYYSENYNNILIFFILCLIVLSLNVIIYFLKYVNFITVTNSVNNNTTNQENHLDIERESLLNRDNRDIPVANLYEDIDNLN